MRMSSPRDKSKPDHDLALILYLLVLVILGWRLTEGKGLDMAGKASFDLFPLICLACELNMVSCLLPSSSLPNQEWQIRKEKEEEAGMVLLLLATVRQTGFKVSGSCKCLRLLLVLVSSSEDSLDQYCPTEI